VSLQEPANHSQAVSSLPKFKWSELSGISFYHVELSKEENFVPVYHASIVNNTFYTCPFELPNNHKLYWRVRPAKLNGSIWVYGGWSDTYDFSAIVTGIQTEGEQNKKATAFPNPFRDVVNIGFQLDSPGNVTFEISDSQGQRIDQFDIHFSEKGRQTIQWHSKAAKSSIYFCKLITSEKIEVVKLILSQ